MQNAAHLGHGITISSFERSDCARNNGTERPMPANALTTTFPGSPFPETGKIVERAERNDFLSQMCE